MEIRTGYEIYAPFSKEVSPTLTQIRVLLDMIMMGIRKKERGYIDYAIKIATSHHLLNLLVVWNRFFPNKLDDLMQGLLKIPHIAERFYIMNRVYLGCRILDNAIDGDSPKKLSAEETLAYVQGAIDRYREGNWDKRNAVDFFLRDALKHCAKIGFEVRTQVLKVLESVGFDAERRADFLKTGQRQFYPAGDIEANYYHLDIEGTCGACLQLTGDGDSAENLQQVAPLAKAVRIFYDIRDLAKETRQGLVNITLEDTNKFGIRMDNLLNWAQNGASFEKSPEAIKAWISEGVSQGETLLSEHDTIMRSSNLQDVTKILFRKNYINQCQPFFSKIKAIL